ncbi:MAG: phage late control D family protein [Defluviitaleaceae bacterium]|nr:phage late control D family protein [Defluviitaleaceae bacterium]
MERIKCHTSIEIESDLPIKTLLTLEIKEQLNDHGRLQMCVIIDNEHQQHFLEAHPMGGHIYVLDTRQHPNPWLFMGKIDTIICKQQSGVLMADVYAMSFTVELEQEKKNRSFQNPNQTFEQIVKQVMAGSGGQSIWHVNDRKIEHPFFQYEEDDWSFLTRLSSHFNCPIQTALYVDKPHFYFGIRKGFEQALDESSILEFGISSKYFEQGGYGAGYHQRDYSYLKVKHLKTWEIGDYVKFQQCRFTVIKRVVRLDETGELYYEDTLGTAGLLHYPTLYNDRLIGLQLEGTVSRVANESVWIEFGFDVEETNYPWKWTPEVGNLCYIMPEVGSRVVLTFQSEDEKEGIATHVLRREGTYLSENHRGLSNPYGQHLRLYPDLISFQGGKESIVGIALANGGNVRFVDQVGGIRLNAKGDINLHGEQLFIQAPERILMKTSQSNIEICKDFNIYAPSGVMNKGTEQSEALKTSMGNKETNRAKAEDLNHWQASYAAIGAVPNTNMRALDENAMIRLRALGSVAKIANGGTVASMSQVMAGKPVEDTMFPHTIANLGNYSLNGGYHIPKNNEEEVIP